jgi:hypothetical protein
MDDKCLYSPWRLYSSWRYEEGEWTEFTKKEPRKNLLSDWKKVVYVLADITRIKVKLMECPPIRNLQELSVSSWLPTEQGDEISIVRKLVKWEYTSEKWEEPPEPRKLEPLALGAYYTYGEEERILEVLENLQEKLRRFGVDGGIYQVDIV